MKYWFLLFIFLIQIATAQPQLDAFPVTAYLTAGKVNELKITLVNLAKPEKIEFGSFEKELYYNASLNAYNFEIGLESDFAEVKTGKILIPLLPQGKSVELSFLVSVPQNISGKVTFRLYVNYEKLYEIKNESGSYSYEYQSEFEVFDFQIDVVESIKPEFRVFSSTSKLYEGEITRISLTIINSGLGEARDVEIKLLGLERVSPEVVYLPLMRPFNSSTLTFEVVPKNERFILALNYLYYDDGWKRGYEEIEISMKIETLSKGLEVALNKSKFDRKEKGVLEIVVMNNHVYPISSLRLKLEEINGLEFEAKEFLLGYLSSGEVRKIAVKYKVDDNANFGIKELFVTAKYRLITSEFFERLENKVLLLTIEANPFFEVKQKALLYHGENILSLEVLNSGGNAKNVHFKLNPSPGIRLKIPEAFVDKLASEEVTKLYFRVDIDEDVISNTDYRVEISYKAENFDGEEVSGSFYAYVRVLEKSWVEKYLPYLIFLLIFALIVAVRIKRMRD
ncbi:MAG: hypothetical protein NZ872_04040 [Archaeoglobaceae archaeon]|nr:hypothetical protein [Archaeoglobaceae archaeon]MDW8128368.1 hypothetical protein [Archaeoglobaceae archaeon]